MGTKRVSDKQIRREEYYENDDDIDDDVMMHYENCTSEGIQSVESNRTSMALDPMSSWKPIHDKTLQDLHGTCACGKAKLVVPKGSHLILSGYCHCIDCRKMSSCPFTCVFVIPGKDLIDFPKEVENDILSFTQIKANGPKRFCCKKCSVYLYSYVKGRRDDDDGMFFINHAPFNAFQEIPPRFHCNYGDKVISIKDGLIKYRYYPPMFPEMRLAILDD